METLYFLGIDISKKKFDAALTVDGKTFHQAQVENAAKSSQSFFRELKKQLSSLDKVIVCLEHTGVYCLPKRIESLSVLKAFLIFIFYQKR